MYLTIHCLAGCAQALEQDEPMQDHMPCAEKFQDLEQIMSDLSEHGCVRVIIVLNIDFTPEKELSEDEIKDQRNKIARAQEELIRETDILEKSVMGRMKTLPFMSLKLSEKQLDDLSCHHLVRTVGYDKTVYIK